MATTRIITDTNAGDARRLTQQIFIADKPTIDAQLRADLRKDLKRVTARDKVYGNLPRAPLDALVGRSRLRDYKSDPVLLVASTRLGDTTVLTPAGALQDIDLVAEAQWVYNTLRLASPVRSGRYRSSFRYTVGGKLLRSPPRGATFSVIGVTNIAPYASVLENPTWPRPFREAWKLVLKRSKQVPFDCRLTYLVGVSEQRPRTGGGREKPYASPVLEIGYYNSMRRTGTGILPARRKRNRRRR